MSKRTLWPTTTVVHGGPSHSMNAGSTSPIMGAGMIIASVMPVSTVIIGGMGTPGLTSVSNVPRHLPPRSLSAPTSVIAHAPADVPVVSRSTTTNVTSANGVPSSSKLRVAVAAGADRAGECQLCVLGARCHERTLAEHTFDQRDPGARRYTQPDECSLPL